MKGIVVAVFAAVLLAIAIRARSATGVSEAHYGNSDCTGSVYWTANSTLRQCSAQYDPTKSWSVKWTSCNASVAVMETFPNTLDCPASARPTLTVKPVGVCTGPTGMIVTCLY